MRRSIGLLAVILGTAGLLLLVAGIVVVWRAESLVVDRTDWAATRASDLLTRGEDRLLRLEGRVQKLTVDLQPIRTAVAKRVENAAEKALAKIEWNQIFDRLEHLLEKSEGVVETLDVVARLVDDAADLSEQLEWKPERTAQLKSVVESLEKASATLSGVRLKVADLRQSEADPDLHLVTDLCDRSRGALDEITSGIDTVRQHSVEARKSLDRIRTRIEARVRIVAVILGLVFLVFVAGQLCLVGWGWKRLGRIDAVHAGSAGHETLSEPGEGSAGRVNRDPS